MFEERFELQSELHSQQIKSIDVKVQKGFVQVRKEVIKSICNSLLEHGRGDHWDFWICTSPPTPTKPNPFLVWEQFQFLSAAAILNFPKTLAPNTREPCGSQVPLSM